LKISLEAPVFHDIPANMRRVMRELEEQNERDQRAVRSVSEDVGRCLALLAMAAPQGAFIELGSSVGYSSLWLSLAARARGVTLTTVELDEKKFAFARENILRAGAAGFVEAVHGDALDYAARFEEIAFCFSDLQPPEHNAKVYEKVVPRLVPGGLLVIDNVTSPRLQRELLERGENDPRVDCVLLPFPKGDLVCRRI
jgi:predicted O-methyltransferase YrrM